MLHQGMQHQSRELHMNVLQTACSRSDSGRETANTGTRLVYRCDDCLTNLRSALQETFPVVLILDTGAHYRNDTTLMEGIRHNIQEIKAWQEQCQHQRRLKCHFFWRTTVPGHTGCQKQISRNSNGNNNNENEDNNSVTNKNTGPVNDIEAMEEWVGNLSSYDNTTL